MPSVGVRRYDFCRFQLVSTSNYAITAQFRYNAMGNIIIYVYNIIVRIVSQYRSPNHAVYWNSYYKTFSRTPGLLIKPKYSSVVTTARIIQSSSLCADHDLRIRTIYMYNAYINV